MNEESSSERRLELPRAEAVHVDVYWSTCKIRLTVSWLWLILFHNTLHSKMSGSFAWPYVPV